MRRILIERARQKRSLKGGGGHRRVELEEAVLTVLPLACDDVLALDEALTMASDHLPIVMDFAGVPEPSTIVLSGLGILALVGCSGRMRRKRRSVP